MGPVTQEQLDEVQLLPDESRIGHVMYKVCFLFLLGAPSHKIAQSLNEYHQVLGSSSTDLERNHDGNIHSPVLDTRACADKSLQDGQSLTFVKDAYAHKDAWAYNSAPAHRPHSFRDPIPQAASGTSSNEEIKNDPFPSHPLSTPHFVQGSRQVEPRTITQVRSSYTADAGYLQAKKGYAVESYFRDRRFTGAPERSVD